MSAIRLLGVEKPPVVTQIPLDNDRVEVYNGMLRGIRK